jgi:hypothetical protein
LAQENQTLNDAGSIGSVELLANTKRTPGKRVCFSIRALAQVAPGFGQKVENRCEFLGVRLGCLESRQELSRICCGTFVVPIPKKLSHVAF